MADISMPISIFVLIDSCTLPPFTMTRQPDDRSPSSPPRSRGDGHAARNPRADCPPIAGRATMSAAGT